MIHNAASKFDVPNHSVTLGDLKPSVKLYYDGSMGHVDTVDQSISRYSIARSYSRGHWIRRYFDTFFDFGLNNSFALYLDYWKKRVDSDRISPDLQEAIRAEKARKLFISQVAIELLTDHSSVSLPSMIASPFSNAFNSIKSLISTRVRCKMSRSCKGKS